MALSSGCCMFLVVWFFRVLPYSQNAFCVDAPLSPHSLPFERRTGSGRRVEEGAGSGRR